nr:MAG TPA: hypothetical protein [Caudoviricetes sp.]
MVSNRLLHFKYLFVNLQYRDFSLIRLEQIKII